MSLGRLSFTPFPLAMSMAVIVVVSARGQESRPGRGRSIEFSEPRSVVVSSNLNQLGEKKTTLKNLEQEIKKPFDFFSTSGDAADRFTAANARRPAPSAARARQMKELLEKRNEWVFLAPEDYFASGLTDEEIFNLPEVGSDGAETKKKTPLERYYERLDKERVKSQVAANPAEDSGGLSSRQIGERQDEVKEWDLWGPPSSLNSGLSKMEQAVKPPPAADFSAFGTVVSEEAATRNVSGIFGFGKTGSADPAPEKNLAMEARMQEFKQLLEGRALTPAGSGAGGFAPLTGLASPPAVASAGLGGFYGDNTRGGLSPLSPNPVSQLALPGLPAATANFGSPSWQMTPPVPETPQVTLPPPTFNIPKRKF